MCVGVLTESLIARLALRPATEKILVVDQYADESAKDHEWR